MDLPGLTHSAPTVQTNVVTLGSECEWRFEVGLDETVTVKILRGNAEIFGTELAVQQVYNFTGTKLSIFTWRGCSLEWSGTVLAEYTSDESTMSSYANLHFALEKLRVQAGETDTLYQQLMRDGRVSAPNPSTPQQEGEGPKVLVIGPRGSGKTSLAKILTAYAVKMGRTPIVASIDPKEPMLSLPGTLSAASFFSMLDVEEDNTWGSSSTTGPMHIPPKNPIVYYFGSDSPVDNLRFYKSLLSRLSLAVSSRLASDHKARVSGTIIDAAGIIDQANGYDLIDSIISEFSVNVVVTIGSERLYNDLLKRFQSRRQIAVIKVQRSGGVVEHDAAYTRAIQQRLFKQYFYGTQKTTLSAFTVTADLASVVVYRRSEHSNLLSSSVLPVGSDATTTLPPLISKLEVLPGLQNSILALLFATPRDNESDVAESSVMGFVHLLDVDETKRKVRILMPIKTRITQQVFLAGQYYYLE
ncbi:Pre-mRNA cleavage complex II protein Clp1-domain-containing protein [Limtongia smithiae]|uniref:Pre-mRNA cleavage complex II protein Clp1-domain-containing protein n=1 Tax=Limtongia smithiae TaxID=1125753 RepID=UPI0034CDCBE2